jgi:hypothetical protein
MNLQLLGFGLVALSLTGDVIFTLTNHPIPAIFASVTTAGLGILFPGILAKRTPQNPPTQG